MPTKQPISTIRNSQGSNAINHFVKHAGNEIFGIIFSNKIIKKNTTDEFF